MAEVELKVGAKLDLLNKGELDRSLKDTLDLAQAARLKGLKPLRYRSFPYATITATAGYTINATPNQGYLWSLRLISVNLSSAQTMSFWLAPDQANTPSTTLATLPPIGYASSATTGSVTGGRGQILMYPGDYVCVSAGGSTTLNSYYMIAWEVPAELAGKLA